ncbi:MAG: NAD(P)H-dependent oxidoreductase subunit E, partial [Clostridia bacterium]
MTRKELEQIRCERLKEISPILLGKNNGKTFVLVCSSTGCESGGSGDLFLEFKQIVEKNEKEEKIEIRKTGCFGLCGEGPIVVVYPKGVFYTHVKKADVQEIFDKHLMGGEVVERLLATDATGKKIETIMENRFYEKQTFIARHQTGKIDPESIEDYVAANGYFAILDILENKKPEDVVCEIKKSGLRGRGGAGFLTGLKWEIGAKNAAKKKFVVCNGDEGDPGAFMDRSIFEGNPHKIVEGLMIAGFATFAHFGVVYIREEYPLAGKRILKAIADAKKMGML